MLNHIVVIIVMIIHVNLTVNLHSRNRFENLIRNNKIRKIKNNNDLANKCDIQ